MLVPCSASPGAVPDGGVVTLKGVLAAGGVRISATVAAAAPKQGMHRSILRVLRANNLETVPLQKPKGTGHGYFPRVLKRLAEQEDPPMVLRVKRLPGSSGDAAQQARAREVQQQEEAYAVKPKQLQLRQRRGRKP